MAEEELPPEGVEPVDAPAEDAAPEPQTEDPIAGLAQELGWVPKEQFRGDPEKWKPADQFIKDGRDIQQSTARELRQMREQMERLSGVSSQILQDKLAEERSRWERELERAVDDGDHAAAKKAAAELNKPAPQTQQGPDPTAAAWVERNTWFRTDPLAAARAAEITDRLARQGYDTQTQLKEAERAIRKEFPEHFPAPAKQPPATQTGQMRNPAPSNRVKGFADMPAESQKIALQYEKQGVKRDDFAKSYWAQLGGKK